MIKNRLKKIMLKKKVSAYKLAKLSGYTEPTIRKWRDNEGQPNLNQLEVLSKCLNVEPKNLF